MIRAERKYLWMEQVVAWLSFAVLLACYWLTVAPTVSYWDCPEYVSAAALLEVGHPPGNPTWMLVERIVTMLAPAGREALFVNLSSGLLTAFAAYFLARTVFRVALWVLMKLPRRHVPATIAAAGGALVAALAFGWCDSTWFSAVEAEVYAMSIFMTSLTVWLMTVWAGERDRARSWRLLILVAYLFGLSIGVHQLNLLAIPALAMVWAVKRGVRRPLPLICIFFVSLLAVALVLLAMMPSTISLAALFEVLAVNKLNLPALAGVAIYVALLGASLLLAITVTSVTTNRGLAGVACFPALFLSGIFVFSSNFMLGLVLSAFAAYFLGRGRYFQARRLNLCMWMLALLLMGYSSYALIPVRGSIPSPANATMPGNPYSFAAYQSREQYGSTPLFHGRTPYSAIMLEEEYDSVSERYTYPRYAFKPVHPQMARKEAGARIYDRYHRISPADSAENSRLMQRPGDAYVNIGRRVLPIYTPELNMFFPRITSSDPSDLKSYAEWIGMDTSDMERVRVSEALDSLGRPVPRRDAKGNPTEKWSYRPTYLQSLQWFATYQTGYMYWRYLLWNFAGRQNDIASQGEVQHGNFITGVPAIDDAMLGAESELPPEAGSDNPGRNHYFMLPLLLGFIGIFWLLGARRRGQQTCAVCAVLFIMTGLAIVVYLNQGPGEPRERDYSFLGSFMAYAVWIGFGAIAVARWLKSAWAFIIPLAIVVWMGVENWDDHDRSGRYAASEIPKNILNSLEPDAVLFVNGDNYTFPFWYAQEVEGVRRDVRVLNLAYMSVPSYVANAMVDWRDSRRVATTLTRGDIIWNAFRSPVVPVLSRDTLPVLEALRQLRVSPDVKFPVRYVTLSVGPDSTMVYDLVSLSRSGTSQLDFGRLMMLDMVANAGGRPVYWLRNLGAGAMIGLDDVTSDWLFGRRFGVLPDTDIDSLFLDGIGKMRSPNRGHAGVYMDRTPAAQVSGQRGALILAGQRFLRRGRPELALEAAMKADTLMGDGANTFLSMASGDTVLRVRQALGQLMLDVADSLQRGGKNAAELSALRSRGRHHIDAYESRHEAWLRYLKALPPRLRDKTAPIP